MSYTYEFFKESADFVLSKIDYKPKVGLILGSDLRSIVGEIENQFQIS
jgi:purine-nucleoside phosphorylase